MIKRFDILKEKYYFDEDAYNWVIEFIESLKHIEGEWAGTNFKLADFQKEDIIMPVFGLKEYKGGPRLIKECYIEIPKKNGKTTLLAAIELYMLFADGEPGAQIYNCAGDDSQADLLFRTAKHMLINDTDLSKISKQLRTEIHWQERYIKKLTSKAETKHGLNAHGVIYDELHAAQDRELYDTLKYAGAQRRNPLFFQITTAGYDKTSICWDRHEYTEAINSGILENDSFWGIIYSASKDDDWKLEETWRKANPIYDYSETFRKRFAFDVKEAEANITVQNAFKRLRLNIWTGSEEKWISDEDWSKGNGEIPDLSGCTCYGGLDLASTSDTTALVFIFHEDEKYYLLPYIFVPERMIDVRDKRNETFYYKWANEGYLIRTPGNITDYNYVEKVIEECCKKYNVKSIGYDPYNARQTIINWNDNMDTEFVEYRQGWATMGEPTKEFERLLLDGKIIHGGHPVLRWMADNAMLRKDVNDNYMVGKGKVSKDKVDGIVASIIALGETIRWREQESEIYIGSW